MFQVGIAAELIFNMGWGRVIFESDSNVLVDSIHFLSRDVFEFSVIISCIIFYLRVDFNIKF
jgi:hypothetical protein